MTQGNDKHEASSFPRLWSVSETARLMGVSQRTVWRLLAQGDLKSVRLGRCVRIEPGSVDALIERGGSR